MERSPKRKDFFYVKNWVRLLPFTVEMWLQNWKVLVIVPPTRVFTAASVSRGQLTGLSSLGCCAPHNTISVRGMFNLSPSTPTSALDSAVLPCWNSPHTILLPPVCLWVISSLFLECPPLFSVWWPQSWSSKTFSWNASLTPLLLTPKEFINHCAGSTSAPWTHWAPGWLPARLGTGTGRGMSYLRPSTVPSNL